MAGDAKKNKRDKLSKVRSGAIPGFGKKGGAARQTGRKIESQQGKNKAAMNAARRAMGLPPK